MKKFLFILMAIAVTTLTSCKKDKEEDTSNGISGEQSPMGQVGTVVSSSSEPIAGVSDFNATVTTLAGGVSTFSGHATVDNVLLRNLVANIPGVTITGNTVSTTDLKFKTTLEGIELLIGPGAGVWVNYGSAVGATYPIGSTGKVRTVVSKSTTDDYSYGFYLIKVMKIEENPSYLKSGGVTKVTYVANHRFGLVGVQFNFDDGSTAQFPIYISAENK